MARKCINKFHTNYCLQTFIGTNHCLTKSKHRKHAFVHTRCYLLLSFASFGLEKESQQLSYIYCVSTLINSHLCLITSRESRRRLSHKHLSVPFVYKELKQFLYKLLSISTLINFYPCLIRSKESLNNSHIHKHSSINSPINSHLF